MKEEAAASEEAVLGGFPWARVAIVAAGALLVGSFFLRALRPWGVAAVCTLLVGERKPVRGFAIVALPVLLFHLWRDRAVSPAPGVPGWEYAAAGAVAATLPYLLHRLSNQGLPGLISTLPLPLWGTALRVAAGTFVPAEVLGRYAVLAPRRGGLLEPAAAVFLVYWFGALLNWIYDNDFPAKKIGQGTAAAGAFLLAALAWARVADGGGAALAPSLAAGWASLLGALVLALWSWTRLMREARAWALSPEALSLLRSPRTGDSLALAPAGEALVAESGERFPVRDGVPAFVQPEDLAGSNQKFNRLYERIADGYDSSQRLGLGFLNVDRRKLFRSFTRLLEAKPGDLVLETSVGTGQVFPHLPRGLKLYGVDLSPSMLANCRNNLRRWGLEAKLFCANAEFLPFASDSFDAVYHVGGINFFSNPRQAVEEMIRVAKPGSRLLIVDETEKHVKGSYERTAVTRGFFQGRDRPVVVPLDLIPPGMNEVREERIWEGRGYVLSFRKPSPPASC